ncbi:MAG: flippase [Candidatus Dormibacteria bacterium]
MSESEFDIEDIDELHADLPSVTGMGARAMRNGALILAARLVSRLIALVSVVVMGNALGAAGYGQYQNAVTYGAIIGVVMDLGLTTLYVREGARAPAKAGQFLSALASGKIILVVAVIPVLWLALWSASIASLFWTSLALVIITSYANILRNTFYATQQLTYEAALIIPEAVLLLLLVLFGAYEHFGPAYYLGAYGAVGLAVCGYVLIVLHRKKIARLHWSLDIPLLRSWLRAGLPLAMVYIITNVYFKMDVPILQHFRSYREVGWYSLAYKPFESLLFIPMTLRAVLFPVVSVYAKSDIHRARIAAEKFFRSLVLAGLPCTIGIALLAPQLTSLLHLYPQSAPALGILALAIVFMFADNTFVATFTAVDQQRTFAWIAATGMVVNLVLDLVLIPLFGYLGASWAVVTTEAFLMVLGWSILARTFHRLPLFMLSWKLLLAGSIMGIVVWVLRPPVGAVMPLLGVIVLAGVMYTALLLLFRVFDDDDLHLMKTLVRR